MHIDTTETTLPVTFFYGVRERGRFQLSPEDSHHAIRVLRHVPGDRLWCIDGSGTAFEVLLDTPDVRAAEGVIDREHPWFNESPGRTELLCGLTQPARMDWVVEKATELGVHEIRPIEGASAPGPGRLRRWSRIARTAAKQCHRGFIPQIFEPSSVGEHLESLEPGGLRLVADPMGAGVPEGVGNAPRRILAVGHDKGFSRAEAGLLAEAGFQPIGLGRRRLRTETAAIAFLARVQGTD